MPADSKRQIAQTMPAVARGWRVLADQVLAEFGVSTSMAWCLIYLERLGPDARQIDLAQAIGISQPSTVRVIDQLEAIGLLTRVRDRDDKRSNRIVLTEAGAAKHSQIEARLSELRDTLFRELDPADIHATMRVLDVLAERISDLRL